MTLPKDVYQALEDIVGPENISEEPAIMDSYAFQFSADLRTGGKSKFYIRPEAAVLPGSAEEVQAIVKACNRYKVPFKAHSTGWGVFAAPLREGAIQLDLRRMNRILEIDEQNMFAVIEPYVCSVQLQAEAMKVGLNNHIVGAGGGCSPLASVTSHHGSGPANIYFGPNHENLLACEWVMPTGEIMRTGSLGCGAGWFCGEGLGPSLRGIFKGVYGAKGSMGVFTKAAVKLAPWPGPAVMPVQGVTPAYESPLPENFRGYTLSWPTWQAHADAMYKIWDAEIGYIAHKQWGMFGEDVQAAILRIITDHTKHLDDLEELLKVPEIQELTEEMRRSFQFIMAGQTPSDIEWQEKALDEILAETGGKKVAALLDPHMERYTLLYFIKMCFKNLNFVYGAFGGVGDVMVPPDASVNMQHPMVFEYLKEHQKKGFIADTGADSTMGAIGTQGGGGYIGAEQFFFYDPDDIGSVKGALEFVSEVIKGKVERGWPLDYSSMYQTLSKEELRQRYLSSPHPNVYRWQQDVYQAFNPNDLGDENWARMEEPVE